MDGNSSVSKLQFGAVTLIPDERLVLKDGRPVSFTPKAFDLLAVLAANPGRLLTKEQLMEAVWPDTVVEESNLTYHVFAIRKALGGSSEADPYIETVPKRGYRFIAPVVRVAADSRPSLPAPGETTVIPARPEESGAVPRPADAAPLPDEPRALPSRVTWQLWLGLATAMVLGGSAYLALRQLPVQPATVEPVRFQEPVAGRLAETGMFAVSPDGRQLVFAAEGADGILRLWVRAMSTLQPRVLPGTEVFAVIPPVVWSPDSRYVAFDPGGVLKKVSLDGGAAQTVCELPGVAVGGSWNGAGDILVGNALGGLVRCPAAGGPAAIVTRSDPARQEAHLFPSFLADGRRFIYLSISRLHPEASGIYLGDLGAESRGLGTRLITTGFGAAFVAGVGSEPGAIVFARDGALFGQRFDERRLQLIGIPIRLAEGIGSYLDGAFFSVSSKILVHRAPEPEFQLTWFDRSGRELGRLGPPARLSGLALSPDDQRALVARHAPQGTLDQDLWMFDFARTAAARRMTFEPAIEASPVWVTNDRFAFGSGDGASGVFQQAIAGKPELLFRSGRPELPTSIAENGRIVLYTTITGNATSGDVWVRTGDGASASVHPFLQHERDQSDAHLSPDRRWVAYVSNETGPSEVSVTRFHFDDAATSPAPGESIRISEGGGTAPRWRSDGRELFYLTLDDSIMAIDVDNQREFRPGTAKPLFKVPGAIPHWGVTRDGARFLFAVPVSPPPPFEIVQDWQATLPR